MSFYQDILEGVGSGLPYSWAGLCVVLESVNATIEYASGLVRRALGEP